MANVQIVLEDDDELDEMIVNVTSDTELPEAVEELTQAQDWALYFMEQLEAGDEGETGLDVTPPKLH